MKLLLGLAVCALALFQVCVGVPAPAPAPALRHVSMLMPSAEERRAGARPRGGIGADAAVKSAAPAKDGTSLFIHNGSKATIGQFPWMLSIRIDSSFFCGGSIISPEWALTAGHCVDGGSSFTMTAGTLSSDDGQEPSKQVSTSRHGFRHPDYNALFIDNDIGLIQLSSPFVLDDNFVAAIRLPSYSMAVYMMAGDTATISGWGLTDDSQHHVSPDLLYVELVINDGSSCYNYYDNVWIPNKICFDTSKDGKSTCQGDSGGPLVIQESDDKWTVIGLTSFGASAGCAVGLPIAFTRVASFLDFIGATTNLPIRDF